MVKIRLARIGKKNDPVYRIVAIESKNKTNGKVLEVLGLWNPRENIKKVDQKALNKWLKSGAQISQTVKNLVA